MPTVSKNISLSVFTLQNKTRDSCSHSTTMSGSEPGHGRTPIGGGDSAPIEEEIESSGGQPTLREESEVRREESQELPSGKWLNAAMEPTSPPLKSPPINESLSSARLQSFERTRVLSGGEDSLPSHGALGTSGEYSSETISSSAVTDRLEQLSIKINPYGKIQPPTRPSFGTRGREISLKTNCFSFVLPPVIKVYHYDVAMLPAKLPEFVSRLVS